MSLFKEKLVKITGVILLTLSISNCSHWTKIEYNSYISDSFTRQDIQSSNKPIGLFNNFIVYNGGIEVNPSSSFEARFIRKLKETDLFHEVTNESVRFNRKIKLNLVVRESGDPHLTSSSIKSFLIGLSFLTLAPILPLRYDFRSSMELEAIRWDGKKRVFEAKAGGYAKYHLFASFAQAGQEIEGRVTNSNINSIINQMVENKSFFLKR